MVWRHGAEASTTSRPGIGGRSGRDLAAQNVFRAQGAGSAPAPAGAAPFTSGTGIAPVAPGSPAPAAASSVDVGRLAEQVTRIILRQAVVERERRGGG